MHVKASAQIYPQPLPCNSSYSSQQIALPISRATLKHVLEIPACFQYVHGGSLDAQIKLTPLF